MSAERVSVVVVGSRTEAELVVGLLRSNGLSAGFAADDAGGQEPQLQLLGIPVYVAAEDEAAARELLAETAAAAATADEASDTD